jgi:hypothetical protein
MFKQSLLNAESLLYNYDQNQTILCRSRTERNIFENMESL